MKFDIPAPRRGGKGKRDKYGINVLYTDGTVFVPTPEGRTSQAHQMRLLCLCRARGLEVATRQVEEDGTQGVRLWIVDQ